MPEFTAIRSEASYVDAEGVTIHYSVWKAGQPKAVVQLVHGLGEHVLRYEALAQKLVAAGYAVYGDDHRGHGRTGMAQYDGDATRLGKVGPGGIRATVNAVRQFTGIIRASEPGLPLAVIGQSWGSLMVQMIVNDDPGNWDAVVLTGTAYRTLRRMNSVRLNARHKHLGNTGNEWLSRDVAVHTAFADDPLTFYANAPKLFGIPEGLRMLGRPARNLAVDVPVLILIGSEDTVGGEKSVELLAGAYVKRSGLTDVRAIVYPEARHEVFNELNKDEVIADLIQWLDERTGSTFVG
jgi:alpha-beta hydrolase superfamily lysophospholipase